MNIENFNRWSTFITNIAVITGIIFLGYELNQNNENLEAQSRFNYRDGRSEGNLLNAHDPVFANIIVKIQNGEELTQAESFQFESYLRYMFVNYEWGYGESLRGRSGLDSEDIQRFFMAFPLAIDFWSRASYSYDDAFQEFIENEVLSGLNQ